MVVGLIIIAVLSLVALVAAKCCGVKIDPIGKAKQYLNDLRDRWKWLDKNLNKFKKFRRPHRILNNESTLYVENEAYEPYYQPISPANRRSIISTSSVVSISESISAPETESPVLIRPSRERPKTLALSRVRYISARTVTPLSIESEYMSFHSSMVVEETSFAAAHRFSVSTVNSDHTPIMICQPPMMLKKGTDFNRI